MKLKYLASIFVFSTIICAGFANARPIATPLQNLTDPQSAILMTNVTQDFNVGELYDHFSNTFAFSIAAHKASSVEGSGSFTSSTLFGNDKNISDFTIGLYRVGTHGVGSWLASSTATGSRQSTSVQKSLLSGNYFYLLTGNATGSLLSSYNFHFATTPIAPGSVVPEPESYAMMLAGLGLLGFTARRKAKASQA